MNSFILFLLFSYSICIVGFQTNNNYWRNSKYNLKQPILSTKQLDDISTKKSYWKSYKSKLPIPSNTIINDYTHNVLNDNNHSKSFDWNKQWYPIAVVDLTDKSRPHHMLLLGNDIVLWYNQKDSWVVFDDSCPHRNVPLSQGRIESNGELLCAYHAWRFNDTGKCTSIPQTKTKEKEQMLLNNENTCVKSYPVQVKQGLIWCWGEKGLPGSNVAIEAALKQPHVIEELYDQAYEDRVLSPIRWNFRDLPYGWDMFMENTLDPAHVAVSHHGIIGNRYKDPQYINMSRTLSKTEILIEDGGLLNPNYPEDKDNNLLDNGYALNDFRPPCLNKIETINNDGSKLILALYATPTKPGYCRHIGAQILIKNVDKKVPKGLGIFALPMPLWLLHITASFFLHQDQVFLHYQERKLYQEPSNYIFGRFPKLPRLFNTKEVDTSTISSDKLKESILIKEDVLNNDVKSYSKTHFTPNEHDMSINKLRRWISEQAQGGPLWGPAALASGIPKVLSNNDLFDVYNSHVKSCKICQKALYNMKIIRNLSLISSSIMAIFYGKTLKLWGGLLSVLFGSISCITYNLIKLFYKYEFHHQDNN